MLLLLIVYASLFLCHSSFLTTPSTPLMMKKQSISEETAKKKGENPGTRSYLSYPLRSIAHNWSPFIPSFLSSSIDVVYLE
ncbi:hypothetical protein BKA57DRAFT_460709 [Linnemannia elongata]|nr:hypothetical protein BKA57DRAFT_460709 [Linnemannia elongata]